LAALEKVFDEMEIMELEDCADYVRFQLGDGKDDKMWPFYYKEYSKDEKTIVHFFYSWHYNHSLTHIQGIFQSYLVTYTLATHITAISGILADMHANDKPIAALVLSIQAVHTVIISDCDNN
jgi:hypothetical protein